MRFALRAAVVAAALALVVCRPAVPPPERVGQVEGSVQVPDAGPGDVYLFLYAPGAGPPGSQAAPEYVASVPQVRLSQGDDRFAFANVLPGSYRLWGFLDANQDFQPGIDVLAQPDQGDRPVNAVELQLAEGQHLSRDLTLAAPYRHSPPSFRVDTSQSVLELPDQPVGPVSLTLIADGLGVFGGGQPSFAVALVDANGDGQPDVNSLGQPVLSPRFFLRFLPKPGQTVPSGPLGLPEEVIVPLVFDPAPFLSALGGNLENEVAVDQLQVSLVPQAQALVPVPGKAPTPTALPAIPVGDYELWALDRSGQFWRVPNALGGAQGQKLGGQPSQAVQFRFIQAADGGP